MVPIFSVMKTLMLVLSCKKKVCRIWDQVLLLWFSVSGDSVVLQTVSILGVTFGWTFYCPLVHVLSTLFDATDCCLKSCNYQENKIRKSWFGRLSHSSTLRNIMAIEGFTTQTNVHYSIQPESMRNESIHK